jgi:hypothetical protein
VTVATNRSTGEKIAVYKNPNIRPYEFAGLSIALARWFNKGYMVWDASGPTGTTFTKRVITAGYGFIYYRRYEKKVTQRISDEPGYFLNPAARETLLEDYRAALSEHKYVNRSDQGMEECLQFVRTAKGIEHSAAANAQDPSGARTAHGDEVIADALACLGLAEHQTQKKAEGPKTPVGSLAWRRHQKRVKLVANTDKLGDGW